MYVTEQTKYQELLKVSNSFVSTYYIPYEQECGGLSVVHLSEVHNTTLQYVWLYSVEGRHLQI